MASEGVCDCGGNYVLKEKKELGSSTYKIIKCERCGHQIARRSD